MQEVIETGLIANRKRQPERPIIDEAVDVAVL